MAYNEKSANMENDKLRNNLSTPIASNEKYANIQNDKSWSPGEQNTWVNTNILTPQLENNTP